MTHDQMKEAMACRVCDKPEGLPLDECHSSIGQANPLCNDYKKCRIGEKSENQFAYAFSDVDNNIFLRACPGSGKTEVVGLKTAYEITRWDREVGGITVLTFTNNAADVISERSSQFIGAENIKYPHFIGTFDSWLHCYIAHPFGYVKMGYLAQDGNHSIRIVSNESYAGYLNNYKTRYNLNQTGNVQANQYHLDHESGQIIFSSGSHTRDARRQGFVLEEWQKTDLHQTKLKFFREGYATYQDIESICFGLLLDYPDLTENISKRFPLIIIDECQDLSWIQLQILKQLKDKGSKLHFIGDLNQAIYEFKKVDPLKVENYVDHEDFEKYRLSDNFRSCQPIVDICKKIVNNDDSVTGKCEQIIESPCICLVYKDGSELHKIPAWFLSILTANKLDKEKSAIIARSWSIIGRMRPSRNNQANNPPKRLAMAIHLWNTGDVQAIEDSISYLGRFFSEKYFSGYSANSNKHHCPECVISSIDWRVFLMTVLEKCNQSKNLIDFTKSGTEWARSVRDEFDQIANDCKSLLNSSLNEEVTFPALDSNRFRAFDAQSPVENLFNSQARSRAEITINTIHGVKGQTFDAVVLVSAPSKQGSNDNHWEHWLDDPSSEAARLAYVASSRPKHFLAWAVPYASDLQKLEDLGFTLVSL